MSNLRKTFVASVMFMTVLAMSVVVVPPVKAAASAGDLIKMDGLSSVYYLGADGKRYVFPNETTYFSWYSDFSTVKTIPQSELESYPLGANVTIRPGTYLVKIQTDPKVYAVEPGGELVWVPDEATAKALYGDNWASRVVDVPDAFFTNYTVTSRQVSSDAYPAGSLIKLPNSADVYYIDSNGQARKIADEAAFNANRFNWDFVITTSDSFTLPTLGTDITGAEGDLIDTSEGAGGTAGAGTGLSVALSGDTPPSRNIPSHSTLVPFLTVNLTASNDGDVTVNTMVFTRKGTGNASDFDGGYLYVGDTRLTTKRSVNTSDNTITFSALNLTVPAGATKAVTLKMNAKRNGTVEGNHYFELSSASAITTNGAVVSGSFPISGNTMSYSTVEAATVTLTGTNSTYTRNLGETGVQISEFTIANNDKEDVYVKRIRLKNDGDATDSAVNNMYLDIDGTVVASGVSMSGRYADFVFDAPYLLEKSHTVTATVYGDIVDDISKSVKLYANNVADIEVRGTAYGDFYSVKVDIDNFDESSEYDTCSIQGSEINVSFDGPQATDVKADTQDVVLANFKISSANVDVNFERLRVVLTSTGASNKPMINLEMVDTTNGVSYSVSDPASSTSVNLDFENVYIEKGVQYNFEIRGDIQEGTNAGTIYAVSIDFDNCVARFQDANETTVKTSDYSSSSLSGKNMTVANPMVYLKTVTTNNSTVVKNGDGVLLFKGQINANSVDDLKISRLKFDGYVGYNGSQSLSGDYERLYLYKVNSDSSETLLDDESSLSLSDVTFSGFTLDIPKGVSNAVYVVVRGDVKDSPSATTTKFRFDQTYSSHLVKDSDNNVLGSSQYSISSSWGHTISVVTKGTFTMDIDNDITGLNNDKNVLAGSEVLVGRIKLTAAYEIARIEDFTLINLTGTVGSDDIASLKLYNDVALSDPISEATAYLDSNKRATFEDVNIEVPTTGVKYVYVGAQLKGIDYSNSQDADATADAGQTIILEIASTTGYTVKAFGKATGEQLDNDNVGTTRTNTSTILGAVITSISTNFEDALLSNGTKEIFSFTVTVPSSSNVDYDGTSLGVKIATTTFTLAGVATTTGNGTVKLSNITVERQSGTNGSVTAKVDGGSNASVSDDGTSLSINFISTYGSNSDLVIRPGETVTYKIFATISDVNSSESMQVTIENVDSNFLYTHNYATTGGTLAGTITPVAPRISGLTSVRGGSLSN